MGDAENYLEKIQRGGVQISAPTSLYNDLNTVRRIPVVDVSSSFGVSSLREEVFSTNSGSVTEDPDPATGEIELSTGGTANSEIEVRTAAYGRYTPGYSAKQGSGIRFESLPDEGEVKWGYFDDNDGFYWGYDGDVGELFVGRLSDGTESDRVYRSDFNGEDFFQVIGKESPDPTVGYIYQIDFSWYGYGIVNFNIVAKSDSSDMSLPAQDRVDMHNLSVTGETSITDPNQPITVIAENGSGGEDVRVRIGGRQYSIFGDLPTDQRITAATVESTSVDSGSWTHIMTWRRSDAIADPNARLSVESIDFSLDQTVRLAIVQNANLSGTSYGSPDLVDVSETLAEVSKAGSFDGIGSGTKTWGGTLQVGSSGNAEATLNPDLQQKFGQNITASLIAKGIGGSGSGISTMRISEDW